MSEEFCVLTAARPKSLLLSEDLNAAKGCFVCGQLFGAALWAVLFGLFFSLT